jgi:hypothetical protein
MSYKDVAGFLARLGQDKNVVAASALELVVFSPAHARTRSGSRNGNGIGSIPSPRTLTAPWTARKVGRRTREDHVIPLSTQAWAVIERMRAVRSSEYIFPINHDGKPIGETVMLEVLRRYEPTAVVDGFLSSFRAFAAEQARAPFDVAEACLGHLVGSKVSRSYIRGHMLERRRELLTVWMDFILPGEPANSNLEISNPVGTAG